jgi:hypothetical protein
MGVYELIEGKKVNGRGVWQMVGEQELFMYYGSRPGNFIRSIKKWTTGDRASNKKWYISDRADMEAGGDSGWMSVASTALTPDQVTETWKVHDGTAWVDAPKVRARMYSAAEKRAAAERLEQERQQAMAAARQVRDVRMLDSI